MSITSPEFVIIVWHDLGDVIYDQMKETVKDLKITVFTGIFHKLVLLTVQFSSFHLFSL